MAIAHSKLTAQGQISVPAEVRKKLGLGPGSVLEWIEDGDKVLVNRAGRYRCDDIRMALFGHVAPKPRSLDALKKGVRQRMRRKYARG